MRRGTPPDELRPKNIKKKKKESNENIDSLGGSLSKMMDSDYSSLSPSERESFLKVSGQSRAMKGILPPEEEESKPDNSLSFKEENDKLKKDIKSKDKEIKDLKKDLDAANKNKETLRKERDELHDKLEALKQEQREIYNSNNELKKSLEDITSGRADNRESKLEAEKKELQSKLEQSEQKCKDMQKTLDESDHTIEDLRKNLDDVIAERDSYKTQLDALQTKNDTATIRMIDSSTFTSDAFKDGKYDVRLAPDYSYITFNRCDDGKAMCVSKKIRIPKLSTYIPYDPKSHTVEISDGGQITLMLK